MPYILRSQRAPLDGPIEDLVQAIDSISDSSSIPQPGVLNYVITSILLKSMRLDTETSYTKVNQAVGVLGCVSSELYRRLAGPYEDQKAKENGDVFNIGDER